MGEWYSMIWVCQERGKAVKDIPLQPFLVISKLKVLLWQDCARQFGGAGRDPLQWIIAEGGAVGPGGHDALFGADHLIAVKFTAMGAVGAPGLDRGLKQFHGDSLPS